MRKFIFGLLIVLIFFGCNNQENSQDGPGISTLISGKFTEGRGHQLIIQKILPEKFVTIDSVTLDENSEFRTNIPVEYPGFFAIRNEKGNYITLIAVGNDTINLSGSYSNFMNYGLSGSSENKEILRLKDSTQSFLYEIAECARIVSDSVESENYVRIKEKTDLKYRAAFAEFKSFSKDFIERNQGSLVTLLALNNQLGRNFFVFNPMSDREIFHKVDSALSLKYPESEAVKQLHAQLEMVKLEQGKSNSKPEVGSNAPDFSLKTPEGKEIRLSELQGKIVLLDFWASWSQPSRDRNPSLIAIYNQYKDKGFEILQISLDRKVESWLGAINEDQLSWLHGSELNFWDSKVAGMYGVSTLPSNFLLNRDGKIIAVNLTPGELKKELDKVFN